MPASFGKEKGAGSSAAELAELRGLLTRPLRPEELHPVIERSLLETARTQPQALVDILFPVILPAIRRAVATLLRSMVEDFNRVLERSFSLRSLRWRMEALRTHRSFAEIALLHNVRFRSSDAFLIHPKTGLVLVHASTSPEWERDATVVSSLLAAIQDFMRESFAVSEHRGLDRIQMGEYTLWIESDPDAVLVVRSRGYPPRAFQLLVAETLAKILAERRADLRAFSGDASAYAPYHRDLAGLLAVTEAEARPKGRARLLKRGLALVAAVAVVAWIASAIYGASRERALGRRLAELPGVFVAEVDRAGGKVRVRGLRDALSGDPSAAIRAAGFAPADVELDLHPILSLDPPIVAARARAILAAPPGVSFDVGEGGELRARGVASAAWKRTLEADYARIPGIVRLRADGVVTPEEKEIRALRSRIEAWPFVYAVGSATPAPSQRDEILRELRDLGRLARETGRTARVTVVGFSDVVGTPEARAAIARARAEGIAHYLARNGISAAPMRGQFEGRGERRAELRVTLFPALK